MSKFGDSIAINAGDVSTNLVSNPIDIRYDYGLAYVVTLTGAPSGSVLLEGTVEVDNLTTTATWVLIQSDTISGTTTIFGNKDALYYTYVRIRKVAGGTGAITARVNVKGS